MNNVLPFVAIAIAIAALALSSPPDPKPAKPSVLPAALALVALICGYFWRSDYPNLLPAAIAFAVGVAWSMAATFAEGMRAANGAAAAGLAAAAAGFAQWVDPSYLSAVQLGLVAGMALGAWSSAGIKTFSLPLSTALFTATFVAGDFMGAKALSNEPGSHFGSMAGLAVGIAGLVALLPARAEKRADGSLPFLPGWLAVVLLLAFGYVVGGRFLEGTTAWMIFDGAVIAAAILHWVIRPEGKDDTLSFLIATVIWIGIATLAFSYEKGFGMAIAMIGAAATFLLLGNSRALLSTGPLLGLVFYRVLREAFPETSRALDIGQHYAVIGLAFGLVLSLLPVDWVNRRSGTNALSITGRLVWAVILALACPALAVVLGAKGMVGMVAGLGFAALVDGLRGGTGLITMVVGVALAAMTTLSYGWLTNLLDLTRESKQTAFFWIGGVGVVLAIVLSLFSKPEPAVEIESK